MLAQDNSSSWTSRFRDTWLVKTIRWPVGKFREMKTSSKVALGLAGCMLAGLVYVSVTASDRPSAPTVTANQVVGNGFIDFKQLSNANFEAMKSGLDKLINGQNTAVDAIVSNKAEIKKVDAKVETTATDVKKVDAKVDQVDGRVKKIETAPPFPYKQYEEDLKGRVDKFIDERLKKLELNMSQHDAKTDSAFAQVLKQLSLITPAQAETAPKQHTAAQAPTPPTAQPASTDPKVQARVQAFIQHCGENEDMKSVWSWSATVSDAAFNRHLKSCDDWAASKHAFVVRNEQRFGTSSYQEARYRPAKYAGDRMLDSLGPQGRVLHKIRSVNDLPPNVRRCVVNTVGARGVPGVAVSQKCLKEHWR